MSVRIHRTSKQNGNTSYQAGHDSEGETGILQNTLVLTQLSPEVTLGPLVQALTVVVKGPEQVNGDLEALVALVRGNVRKGHEVVNGEKTEGGNEEGEGRDVEDMKRTLRRHQVDTENERRPNYLTNSEPQVGSKWLFVRQLRVTLGDVEQLISTNSVSVEEGVKGVRRVERLRGDDTNTNNMLKLGVEAEHTDDVTKTRELKALAEACPSGVNGGEMEGVGGEGVGWVT
jgi:hypothetical protein